MVEWGEIARRLVRYGEKEASEQILQLAEELRKMDKESLKREASLLARNPTNASIIALAFWNYRKDILDRKIGQFFKYVLSRLEKHGGRPPVFGATNIALLSLAANHDISTLKQLHDLVPSILSHALSGVEDPLRYLGRRPLARLLRHAELLNRYAELLSDLDVPRRKELVPRIEEEPSSFREKGKLPSWTDAWLDNVVEQVLSATSQEVEREGSRLHPRELKQAAFFREIYRDSIDPKLRNLEGSEFYRYKFGNHYKFLEELERELERISNRGRKYRIELAKNVLEHLAAQVVHGSCTSWPEYILDILHGPSVPIVVKDKSDKKTVGRLFLTVATHKSGKKYIVYGDYVGNQGGLGPIQRAKDLVERLSQKHFGTKPIHWSDRRKEVRKLKEGLAVPHKNPWI